MKSLLNGAKISMLRGRFILLAALLAAASILGSVSLPGLAHAAVGSVSQYSLPLSSQYLERITLGPDNNIWYTTSSVVTNPIIGKLAVSGSFTQYGGLASGNGRPLAISKGLPGNVWFAEQYMTGSIIHYRIVNITTSGVMVGQYNLPSDRDVSDMTLGPDGNVWFSENGSIGKITPAGVITESLVAGANATAGPDGNVWFTYAGSSATDHGVGKITPSGAVTRYPVPYYYHEPKGIVAGPDGNMWFTEPGANKIGKITTSGTITQYNTIPTSNAQPLSIVAGSDGALWFIESQAGKIGRITTSGSVAEYSVFGATAGSLRELVAGPDGAVWFRNNNTIGRMATELTNQSISFTSTAPTSATVESLNYTPVASATSGLPVTITVDSTSSSICSIDGSGSVSYQSAGTCTLNADQAGNADYKPAPQVQQSFTVLPVNADLSVTLGCPAAASVGDTVTCTITATNNGLAASQNTTLSAVFPAMLSGATVTGGATLSGQNISWTTPSLASGGSVTITLSATASVSGKVRLNAAVLQTSPDPDNSNNFTNSTLVIS